MSADQTEQSIMYDRYQQFSDLVLSVGESGQEFKVHKYVVCSQSEMLMTACSGRFIEAQTNRVELPTDRPDIISRVLDYLYVKDYNDHDLSRSSPSIIVSPNPVQESPPEVRGSADTKSNNASLSLPEPVLPRYVSEDQNCLDVNARIYTCALRLGIPPLCDHSFSKIESIEPFLLACLVLPSTLEHIFRSTQSDDRLRRLITDSCIQYHECLNDPFLRHNPLGDDVVEVMNEFEPMAWCIGVAAWNKIRSQEEALLRQNFELMELKHKDFGVWRKPKMKIREQEIPQEEENEEGKIPDSDCERWFDCSHM